ncbi:amidohydrolase [Pseudoroseicyclus tamaricis]|uniref:Amidohydrolase n=1 Tax=Pseudoroseicyclus tamaricis TaxID=2705421 RepID=A0A6B2JV76_9RHOB|nr:amidohydrolase [Pseudoroseicyclus tamaricis]NDV02407.1 amidohydrolase [Pseudoroseicyclus tamaricis]
MSLPRITADTLLINADIRTMDPLVPRAEALAIAGGRILAAGSEAEMRALAGEGAEVLDAGGRLVLPGFHDTHIHLQDGGHHTVESADLTEAGSAEEIVEAMAAFAGTHDRPWVFGSFYNSALLTEKNLSAAVLDRAVPDRPAMVTAADAHNACINTAAMRALGLTAATEDPPEGHFVRDAEGNPTGYLHERAVTWVNHRRPQPTDEEYREGVLWAQAHANEHGITGVLDALVEERHRRIYAAMAEAGELTVRVVATALVKPGEPAEEAVARLSRMREQAQYEMFRIHSAKFFFDGVVENRTAAMIEDYSDEEGGNFPVMFPGEEIAALFPAFDAARFQIHVHCIGDGAVRAALDGMELARKRNGPWPSRHQIAHIQFIDPADIPRFAELGVVANVQPLWARMEAPVSEMSIPVVGPERSKYIYAFGALTRARAELVLSSDWTVSTLNPFAIIETAITRKPGREELDVEPLLPEEALTIEQCVAGYTMLAARAGWRDAETGSLSPGKQADLIVLDQDIFACDPRDIGETKVVMTMLGGRAVHGGV